MGTNKSTITSKSNRLSSPQLKHQSELVLKVEKTVEEYTIEVVIVKDKRTQDISFTKLFTEQLDTKSISLQFFSLIPHLLRGNLPTYGQHLNNTVENNLKSIKLGTTNLHTLDIKTKDKKVKNYVIPIEVDFEVNDMIIFDMYISEDFTVNKVTGFNKVELMNNLLLVSKGFTEEEETKLIQNLFNSGEFDCYYDEIVQIVSTLFKEM